MKSLNEYLIDAKREFNYRIKVAGELPKENFEKLKKALEMFDVIDITQPKKTPIQSSPIGFPHLRNEEINIIDVILNYPANSDQIIDLARRSGIEPSRVIVIDKDFDDSMSQEIEGVEDGTRLENPNYPEQTKSQKKASDDYANSYQEAAATFANGDKTEFEIAGKGSEKAKFNTDNDEGKDSPFSKVKRKKVKDLMK